MDECYVFSYHNDENINSIFGHVIIHFQLTQQKSWRISNFLVKIKIYDKFHAFHNLHMQKMKF